MDKDVARTHSGGVLRHSKDGNPAIGDNLDELWGHYATWNKPDRERQKLLDIVYM